MANPPCSSTEPDILACRSRAFFFEHMFNQSTDCLFFVRPDADGRLVLESVNSAAMKYVTVSYDQALGKHPIDVAASGTGLFDDGTLAEVFKTGEVHRRQPHEETQGGTVRFDAVYSPVYGSDGGLIGVLGSARDITNVRALEDRLRHTQRIEALGALSGGIAHDLANVLTALSGCLHLPQKRMPSSECSDIISEAQRTIDRGTAITGRLLSFIHKRGRELARVDVVKCLIELAPSITRFVGNNVELSITGCDTAFVMVDRHELETVIINLVTNSRDAMPNGGRIVINVELKDIHADSGCLEHYVLIGVHDTGTGIPPDLLKSVMEPYFTTKPDGAGTGLGLSLASDLMRSSGGHFYLESVEGEGTTAYLRFKQV